MKRVWRRWKALPPEVKLFIVYAAWTILVSLDLAYLSARAAFTHGA